MTYNVPSSATGSRSFTTLLFYDQGADVPITMNTTITNTVIQGKVIAALSKNITTQNRAHTFVLNYTNTSNQKATGVYASLPTVAGLTISNNQCGSLTKPITLVPHAACNIDASYRVPHHAAKLQSFTTTLSYDQGENIPLTVNTAITDAAITGKIQTGLPKNVFPGENYMFIINYTNNSDKKATGVYIIKPVAPGLTLNTNQCGDIKKPITLAPHTICSFAAIYKVPDHATGSHSFTTTLSYDEGINVPVTNSTTIAKVVINGSFMAALPRNTSHGSLGTFILVYKNTSDGTATNVSVGIPTAPGLSLEGNSCGVPDHPITLAPHAICSVGLSYAPPKYATGLQSFTTTFYYAQGANIPLTASTTITNVAINGAVITALPKHIWHGESHTFVLNYTNHSNGFATDVSLSLAAAPGLMIDNNSCGVPDHPITLAPYASCSVAATYTPTEDAVGLQIFSPTLYYAEGANIPFTISTTVDKATR